MIVTHQIIMDLVSGGNPTRINLVQDDKYSRNLEFSLFANGSKWIIPDDTTVLVRYFKPDGTSGSYDALPDGAVASTITDNVLTIALAPQVSTQPGIIRLAVSMYNGQSEISTFTVILNVQKVPGLSVASEDYYKVSGMLSASGWEPDCALTTDENGNVVASSKNIGTNTNLSGFSQALRVAIYNLLMDGVYQSSGHEADKATLEELLTGNPSDNDSGSDEPLIYYTITKMLTGCSIDNGTSSVIAGSTYSAVLAADDGFTLTDSNISVVMGGEVVTTTDGVIFIESVTGNIIITAEAAADETGSDSEEYNWTSGTPYDLTGKITSGIAISESTGVQSENANRAASDYFDCFSADYLYHTQGSVAIHFYDVNRNWIRYGYLNKVPSTITVPENAVFFRLCGSASVLTESNEQVIPITKSESNYTSGSQNLTWETGEYDTDGTLIVSSKKRTNIFPVSGASSLTFGESASLSGLALYDANGAFITRPLNIVTPIDLTTEPYIGYSYMAVFAFSENTITLA